MEIWKFKLHPFVIQDVKMPSHARVLSAAFQGDTLQVWAVVVPSNTVQNRRFFVAATGQPSEETVGAFVGTVFSPHGLVFHVFDRGYEAAGDN